MPAPVQIAPCPSCKHPDTHNLGPIAPGFFFAGQRLDPPLPGGNLYCCPACLLCFRFPRPPQDVLEVLYKQAPSTNWIYEQHHRPDWSTAHDWLSRRHPAGGRILDLGCYDGAFLDTLPPSWQRFGVEMSEAALARARQRDITILGRDIMTLPPATLQMHAATAFDVIEHVADPLGFLRRMAGIVCPGGTIIISTGNTRALPWRLMGSRYWYCTIPEHISFINDAWCQSAAQQLNLQLLALETYSHDSNASIGKRIYELGTNLLYRFAPSVFALLRRMGFGDKNTRQHEALQYFPPTWSTAHDHIVAIFARP